MVQWMRNVVSSRIDDAAGVMTIDAGGVGNAPTKCSVMEGDREIYLTVNWVQLVLV